MSDLAAEIARRRREEVIRCRTRSRRFPSYRRLEKAMTGFYNYARANSTSHGMRPRTISERVFEGECDKNQQVEDGDKILSDLLQVTGEFGNGKELYVLHGDQKVMRAHCIGALLPYIYGSSLEANRERLCKKLGLKKLNQMVFINAARRAGKTFFSGIQHSGMMIVIPHINILCFAMNLRISRMMVRLVFDLLRSHPKGKRMIVKHNADKLELLGDQPWKTKTLEAIPVRTQVCLFFLKKISRSIIVFFRCVRIKRFVRKKIIFFSVLFFFYFFFKREKKLWCSKILLLHNLFVD